MEAFHGTLHDHLLKHVIACLYVFVNLMQLFYYIFKVSYFFGKKNTRLRLFELAICCCGNDGKVL